MTRARTRYRPNPAFEGEVLRSRPVAAAALIYGKAVAATATVLAPKGESLDLSRSIEALPASTQRLEGETTTTVRVIARDWKAGWHEFGTAKMKAHPFLSTAVRSVLPRATFRAAPGRGIE